MDANDLTPYQRDLLARAWRTPAIREALDFLGPLDLQSTLGLARDLERLQQEPQRAIHFIHTLRTALRQPGALDRLRTRRAEPWARDLLLVAYRLGLMGQLVRHPEEYRIVGRVALALMGHKAWCDHCKNPVFDRAVYGRDPVLRQRARRGWIVLTDTMYLVRGPDGEREVCRPCVERCAFRCHDDGEDGEALRNAGEF